MQSNHLKSQITSEDASHQLERLVQQLDVVKHIAEAGFWLATDELGILLNLEHSFIDSLNLEVQSQTKSYRFSWRNFDCVLVDRQFERGFWSIKNKQNTNVSISPEPECVATIQDTKPLTNNDLVSLNISIKEEVIPSPYALIDDFLSASQLNDLLRYSINKQADFVPTTNSANDPNYRRSFY